MSDLTVFVGTYNRTDTLARCIRNLEAQEYPKRIVIVDNGSRDPDAQAYLDEISGDYTVHRMPAIEDIAYIRGEESGHGGHGMAAVQANYSTVFKWEYNSNSRWFAVCDCDTAPDGPPNSLGHYVYLAEELGCAVGPHLSLNVHRNYPLRSFALITHARVLFRDRMIWYDGIPYSSDPIDSSFHLFPAAKSFSRLKMDTIRVGYPWWATHTDWLIDACNPTPENHAYILGSGDAASWGGRWIKSWFQAWIRSPQEAFALMERQDHARSDYCQTCFILSWMLQYGHGCVPDRERSRLFLRSGTPEWSPCWEYEEHWDALVAGDDTCLGWK